MVSRSTRMANEAKQIQNKFISKTPDAGEEGLHLHGGVDGPEGAGGQGAPAGGRRPQLHRVGGQHPPWREEPQLVELWLEKKK